MTMTPNILSEHVKAISRIYAHSRCDEIENPSEMKQALDAIQKICKQLHPNLGPGIAVRLYSQKK